MALFSGKKIDKIISRAQRAYDKGQDIFFESDVSNAQNMAIISYEYKTALKHCEKALKLEQNNIKALNLKSSVLISLKKDDDALQTIEKVLQADADNIPAQFNKACILYESKNNIVGCKAILKKIVSYRVESEHDDYGIYCDAKQLLEALG